MSDLFTVVKGDITTDVPAGVLICHQCNCITTRAVGVAEQLYRRFPYSNVYNGSDAQNRFPGRVTIRSRGNRPSIAAMYAQMSPGRNHGREQRHRWFQECLQQLYDSGHKQWAMPYLIGCGHAGGDWRDYKAMLNDFLRGHPDINLTLYQFIPK